MYDYDLRIPYTAPVSWTKVETAALTSEVSFCLYKLPVSDRVDETAALTGDVPQPRVGHDV
eukprot:7382741-Prymnesium_polylepis.4